MHFCKEMLSSLPRSAQALPTFYFLLLVAALGEGVLVFHYMFCTCNARLAFVCSHNTATRSHLTGGIRHWRNVVFIWKISRFERLRKQIVPSFKSLRVWTEPAGGVTVESWKKIVYRSPAFCNETWNFNKCRGSNPEDSDGFASGSYILGSSWTTNKSWLLLGLFGVLALFVLSEKCFRIK